MSNPVNKKIYLKNCKKYKKYNYKEISEEDLKYLHDVDLNILNAIIKIFDENGIEYCAVGGTLLGAYTTGKYIPWDEDVDLAVFEEDYERMQSVLMERLPDSMIVQCNKTEKKYYHEWIKVSDKYSTVVPNITAYKCNGCWVDIYKLRKMEKRNVEKEIIKDHFKYLKRRLSVKDITINDYFSRINNNHLYSKLVKSTVMAFISKEKEYVYLIGTASKPYIESKYVWPLENYDFEGMKIKSFHDAQAYLINHYGKDYMSIPPEEDRMITICKVEH